MGKYHFRVVEEDHSFMVVDNETDKVVTKKITDRRKAHKIKKFLNNGGAFNGRIPEYLFNGWQNRPEITKK